MIESQQSVAQVPPLYGLMRLDWLMRFAMMAIVGTAATLIMFAVGEYGFGLLLLGLSALGWIGFCFLWGRR